MTSICGAVFNTEAKDKNIISFCCNAYDHSRSFHDKECRIEDPSKTKTKLEILNTIQTLVNPNYPTNLNYLGHAFSHLKDEEKTAINFYFLFTGDLNWTRERRLRFLELLNEKHDHHLTYDLNHFEKVEEIAKLLLNYTKEIEKI